MDANTLIVPPPEELHRRIIECREEMAQLKKMLRLSIAARKAEEARRRRQSPAAPGAPARV